jgi:hypothetical protein
LLFAENPGRTIFSLNESDCHELISPISESQTPSQKKQLGLEAIHQSMVGRERSN